jgi:hypothetical protein
MPARVDLPTFGRFEVRLRRGEHAARERAAAQSADGVRGALISEGMAGDSVGIMLREVPREGERVLFGQARVDPEFSKKPEVPDYLKGKSLEEIAGRLQDPDDPLSSDDIVIHAFEYEGQLVSDNTRGLTVLSMAGMRPTNIRMIEMTRKHRKRLNETSALGDQLPSTRIAITPSQGDHTVRRVVHIPD